MTTRRTLTPSELTFADICFERIELRHLSPREQEIMRSLRSYFDWNKALSSKQLDLLRALKLKSDKAKRRDAIARGALSHDDDTARTTAKLNTVYNPIGR